MSDKMSHFQKALRCVVDSVTITFKVILR